MSDKYQTRCKGILRGVQFGWNEYEGVRHPQVVGRFEMLDGDNAGQYETWFGSLSDDLTSKGDKSFYEFTVDSLRACGWDGDDLSQLPALVEAGHCANEVGLVREFKQGQDGKWRSIAKYVNRLGAVKIDLKENAMSDSEVADFARRMKSKLGGKSSGNGGQRSSGQQATRNAAPPPSRRRNEEPPDDFYPDDAPPYEP